MQFVLMIFHTKIGIMSMEVSHILKSNLYKIIQLKLKLQKEVAVLLCKQLICIYTEKMMIVSLISVIKIL